MLDFEQVKLLEAKVAKAISYVERLHKERSDMLRREAELTERLSACNEQEAKSKAKLQSCQSRIAELEVLVARFKEDQGKIEESILSALGRLSQFEKDIEKSLKEKPGAAGAVPEGADSGEPPAKEPKRRAADARQEADIPVDIPESESESGMDDDGDEGGGPAWEGEGASDAEAEDEPESAEGGGDSEAKGGELDIF
jgi:chromosome segregation ATPase